MRNVDSSLAVENLVEPHRRELRLHCYRMLGSLQEAEDAVQETVLRAWRRLDSFEGRASLRHWLFRIATNVCLDVLARRATMRRVLPEMYGRPNETSRDGPADEIAWIEPYPDAALEGTPDSEPGPEARYEMHEAVQLAFIAAIQQLPPRQRAILLLRDVVGWSAHDSALLLDISLAAANSALQRARDTLRKQFPGGRPVVSPAPDKKQRALLDQYVRAWESGDMDRFVALLKEDAVYSMPPLSEWYRGREAIRNFFAGVWDSYGGFHLIFTAANGRPAFGVYSREPDASEWRAHSIQVLELQSDAIAALTLFKDPGLFAALGLQPTLPA